MRLTKDEIFVQNGKFDLVACQCRLRVWEEEGRPPVVAFSQLPDYNGPSVTNRIERLAWETYVQMGQPASGITVVQHYPDRGPWRKGKPARPGTVDVVTFTRAAQGFESPCWQPVSKEEITAITGQPLPD